MDEYEELPIADAARRLGIDISTLRRRLKRGEHEYVQDSRGRYTVRFYVGPAPGRDAYAPRTDAYTDSQTPMRDAYAPRTDAQAEQEQPGRDAYALYLEVLQQRDYLKAQNQQLMRHLDHLLTERSLLDEREVYELSPGRGEQSETTTLDITEPELPIEEVGVTPRRQSRWQRLAAWWARMDGKAT